MIKLHNPTTRTAGATPKAHVAVSKVAMAGKRGFDLGDSVVGRFLHRSSVFFLLEKQNPNHP